MGRRWSACLLVVLWVTSCVVAGADNLQLDYGGTFSDVTFPNGQRLVKTLRIEVRTPPRGGLHQPRPGLSGVVRIVDGKSVLDYTIRNAYVSSDARLYLATHGTSSLTLMIPPSGNATLLFSDRPSAREVKPSPAAGSGPPR